MIDQKAKYWRDKWLEAVKENEILRRMLKETDMPNNKGFFDMHQPDSKSQPARLPKREANVNGDGHDFNIKGKITNTAGSDYHDVSRPNSGLHGNFAEKDAQMSYLTERGKKGQVIRSYSGTNEQARLHSHNTGPTAYNGRPIDEVYKPATSQNVPPTEAVTRPTAKTPESSVEGPSQKRVAKKLK